MSSLARGGGDGGGGGDDVGGSGMNSFPRSRHSSSKNGSDDGSEYGSLGRTRSGGGDASNSNGGLPTRLPSTASQLSSEAVRMRLYGAPPNSSTDGGVAGSRIRIKVGICQRGAKCSSWFTDHRATFAPYLEIHSFAAVSRIPIFVAMASLRADPIFAFFAPLISAHSIHVTAISGLVAFSFISVSFPFYPCRRPPPPLPTGPRQRCSPLTRGRGSTR